MSASTSPRSEGYVSKPETDGGREASLHQLAAGTVHDVNNLLVLVIGCAEMALDDETLSPRTRQLMQEILGVGERASSLTRQFLTLGQPARPRAPVDVAAVLTSAESLLRRICGDRVQVWLDPGPTPQWVLAESSQLDQILVNLATNARDAMPAGGTLFITVGDGTMPARADASAPSLASTRITVVDSGRGVDPAVLDRMFEAFITTKREGKGSGLGLAVVRAIVEDLGGSIAVTTAAGQGTTFTIDLPQAPEATSSPGSAS